MKKILMENIEKNNTSAIVNQIQEICMDSKLMEECFEVLIDLYYESEDLEIKSMLDLYFYNLSKCENIFGKIIYIIEHIKYQYSIINNNESLNSLIFHNDKISSRLFFYLMIKNVRKYREEIIELINNTNVDVSSIEISTNDKIKCFYKTIGLTGFNVRNNMLICLELLSKDDLPVNPLNDMVLVFGRFYGWNYMKNSIQLLKDFNAKSDSQKKCIEILDAFVKGYLNESSNAFLSSDFSISIDVVSARNRIELEQMNNIKELAKKKSVSLKFFPQTKILFGNKVAYNISNSKNADSFIESKMQNIKVEYELPLDLKLNPIDFNHTINFLLNGGNYETDN